MALVAACLCLMACAEDAVSLDFSEPAESNGPSARPDEAVLRVGIGAIIGPVETYQSHVALMRYLARAVDRRAELVQRRTYEEMNRMLVSGEVDVAFICTGAYVAIRDRVILLAVPLTDGEPSYHSSIIAQPDGAQSLLGLRGQRFAFTDPLSQTGRLYPMYRLRQELAATPRQFFGSVVYSGSHDESVRLVVEGLVDGAAVDEIVLNQLRRQHPDWEQALAVIDRSPPFGAPPVVARAGLPEETIRDLRAALLRASTDPEARGFLREVGVDGFAAEGDYGFAVEVAEAAMRGPPEMLGADHGTASPRAAP